MLWFMSKAGKAILSLLLVASSYVCFCRLQPPVWTQSTTYTTKTETGGNTTGSAVGVTADEMTESTSWTSNGRSKFWELIGIGCLVLAVWIWRKELGIKGIAGLDSDDITQQPAGTSAPSPGTSAPSPGTSAPSPGTSAPSPGTSAPAPEAEIKAFVAGVRDEKEKALLNAVLDLVVRCHSVNVSMVASRLRIPASDAKGLLLTLRRSGILRADGLPGAALFTLAASVENLVLDRVRELVALDHSILLERRYVRVRQHHDVDSILTCDDRMFVVEAKYVSSDGIGDRLEGWVTQLLDVASEFPGKRVGCILAVACKAGLAVDSVKQEVGSVTFDSGSVPVQVLVFSDEEIRGARGA